MHRFILAIAAAIPLIFAAGIAAAQEAIGSVTRIQGASEATRDGNTRPLALDSDVFLNDVVRTGGEARLEVTFADGTELTLGADAKMTLDTFVYDPAGATGRVNFGVVGAFRFVSGQVSKLANTDVAVATPVAVVGIRGTDFWGGPIDDQVLGVFLAEGAVSVSNAAGEQILDAPGEGTNIAAPGDAPGPVTLWPQDKVDRAIATVTFQ